MRGHRVLASSLAASLVASSFALGTGRAAPRDGASTTPDPAVAAEAAYFEGLDLFRQQQYPAAIDAFVRALRPDVPDELRTRALQALARSAREAGDADLPRTCPAVQPHLGAIAELPPKAPGSQQALVDLDLVRARCQHLAAADTPEPEPDRVLPRAMPPTRPDYATAWVLTTGAATSLALGGVLAWLAIEDRDARDAAARRFDAATTTEARIAAAREVGRYEGRGETEAWWSAGLLAVGGVMVAGAIWAWSDPPEVMDGPFSFGIGPRGVSIGGAF